MQKNSFCQTAVNVPFLPCPLTRVHVCTCSATKKFKKRGENRGKRGLLKKSQKTREKTRPRNRNFPRGHLKTIMKVLKIRVHMTLGFHPLES